MHNKISRRAIVKGGFMAGAFIPALALTGHAAPPPAPAPAPAPSLSPLDPADPMATALAFSSDSTKVSASANPTFTPDQKCATCAQFQGKAGDASGPCTIFPGKTVPSGGWCKVWAKKPAA
jgi:hypothetical protein